MLTSGLVFAAGLMTGLAQADPLLPSGGTVASGSASILQNNSSSTLINQQSQRAIINWQNFSVASGASVTFQQPDSGAITLNRVTGGGLSAIDGSILANGQVWLLNRNGVLFGPSSHIDVGGLLATTSDIKDADFLSGNYAFGDASQNGRVVNQGSIKAATGGSVVLSATHVVNQGVIAAKLGHVILGGAKAFSVDFDGDNLIRYQVTAPVTETPKDQDGKPVTALVENSGTIAAQGGQVLMTARAARDVVDHVINTTGIIQANTVSVHNGEVVLDAGDGAALVAGTVDASGQRDGETGGVISMRGEKIAVADGAKLDASGQAGGGAVSIGASQSLSIGKAVITADAVKQGQGGSVAIISSGTAKVAASLSAKGVSGGGHVETSGAELDISDGVRVDTSASEGSAGLWLLDPVDVTIDTPTAATIVGNLAGTNVSVTASNDITVNSAITYTSANSLTFLAGHNLTVNANVQNGGSGAILAVAGWDGVTAAPAILTIPGAYGQGGGSVLIGGAGASGGVALGSRAGATTIAAQNLDLTGTNGFAQLGYHGQPFASVTTGGDIAVQLRGGLTMAGSNTLADAFTQIGHGGPQTAGTLLGNISVTAQGAVTLAGGTASRAYSQIGNGGGSATAVKGGKVQIVSGGDVSLNSGAFINATGVGDALVVATAGNFINQVGFSALEVSGGGRWLVFLNAPANNTPGGLHASPFYNRAFDFSANSYAPVTGTGNRFVYALAPVLTVTANGQAKVYGSANPALTATITGALPGDGSAGVSGAASLFTAAINNSDVGNYPIIAGLGTLASDFNYGFQFIDGTLRIDPALLTASLTGTIRKTYDGTIVAAASAANYQLSGVLFGDSVNVSGSAVYNDKNAGTAKTVTVSSLVLSGADAGNYLLAAPTAAAAIGIIDPASLTASLTGSVRKTYDGTTAAALAPSNYDLAGAVAGDNVALNNPAIGSYSDKNVGAAKTVTVGGLSLSGADAGNYLLTSSSIFANIGAIDPAALTASLIGTVHKTYDGTAVAILAPANYGLAGAIAGDSVTLNNPTTGSYDDKNVGTGKTVTVGGLALTGADAGNYLLTSSSISANIGVIDPAALTATASLTGTVRKTYDGTNTATLTPANYSLAGVIAGDGVTLNNPTAGSYSDKNVGVAKTVTVSGLALSGADAGNYLLASSTISANLGVIDPAVLTASLTGSVRKIYDGNANATFTPANYALAGAVTGDSVTLNNPATGSYADKNVGTGKTVTVAGLALSGADAGNYLLTSSTISANIGVIDPAGLTATASLTGTVRKTYDGTNTATLTPSNYALAGVAPGDVVALNNPTTGSYSDKNAGTAKTVTVSGLALLGANAGNYTLTSSTISANIGVIDPAVLTASLTGLVRKTYDGNTNAALNASNYGLAGIVAGDNVALNTPANGSYNNKNAGNGKTITVNGLALSGANAGNYVLNSSSVSANIGVIDPAGLTVLLTGTVQKIFDGTTDASLDASNYVLTGAIAGDDVTLNNPALGVYDSKFVGAGKTISVGGLALSGSDAGNYILSATSLSDLIGVILVNRAPDVLGNSFTSGAVQTGGAAAAPTGGGAPAVSDATADTGAGEQSDSASFALGKSLGGPTQSTSSVLIDGLLRQFTPAPGSNLPHGIPPFGQVYSSWGNEAFWQ